MDQLSLFDLLDQGQTEIEPASVAETGDAAPHRHEAAIAADAPASSPTGRPPPQQQEAAPASALAPPPAPTAPVSAVPGSDIFGAYEAGLQDGDVIGEPAVPEWWPAPATGASRKEANATAQALAKHILENGLEAMVTNEIRSALAAYSGEGGIGASLNEYYTPIDLCRAIWGVLSRLRARAGAVLEPSAGTGAFVATAPAGNTFVTVEPNENSASVQKVLFPGTFAQWAHAGHPDPDLRDAAAEKYADGQRLAGTVRAAAIEDFKRGTAYGVDRFNSNEHVQAGQRWSETQWDWHPTGVGPLAQDVALSCQRIRNKIGDSDDAAARLMKAAADRAIRFANLARRDLFGLARYRDRPVVANRNQPIEQHATLFEAYARESDTQFDIVIGNPPFGVRGGTVGIDGRNIARAEEYFLHRGVMRLRPGGYLAMVVPSGFMQTLRARTMRRAISRDAELVTAFRLPSSTFAAAGTQVTADVIVLRRRPDAVSRVLRVLTDEQVAAAGILDDAFIEGRYFEANPELVLGATGPGWRERAGMGHDFEVAGTLENAIAGIDSWEPDGRHNPVSREDVRARLLAAGVLTQEEWGEVVAAAGGVRIAEARQQDEIPPVEDMGEAVVEAVRVGGIVRDMLDGNGSRERAMQAVGDYLNTHGAPSKIGAIGEWLRLSRRAAGTSGVPAFDGKGEETRRFRRALNTLLASIRDDGTVSDRLAGRQEMPSFGSVAAAISALAVDPREFVRADVRRLLDATVDVTDDQIDQALEENELLEPCAGGRWLARDAFYGDMLWDRYDMVQAILQDASLPSARAERHRGQAERLLQIIAPVPLDEVEITVNAPFITPRMLDAFMRSEAYPEYHALDRNARLTLRDGLYRILDENDAEHDYRQKSLIVRLLNRYNVAASEADDVYLLNTSFADWLLRSRFRAEAEDLYNRSFRTGGRMQRRYADAPIAFQGINLSRRLNGYHNASVRWAAATGRGVSASDVGVGKTTEMIMTARYMAQTGDIRNPVFITPKSVAAKWCQEIERWFPGSNLLLIGETTKRGRNGAVTTKSDTADVCRGKFHSLAQNNYDFVVITEEAWNRIDVDPARKWLLLQEDFDVRRGEALGNKGNKAVQKAREQYSQYVARRDFEARDDTVYVNDLGIEFIAFDEIHRYKNLFAARNRFGQSPKFLGGSGESIRAFDTYLKLKAIRDENPDVRIFGASATPAKNSPLEVYSIMALVDPAPLLRVGIRGPEDFLDRFVEFEMKPTLDLEGSVVTALVTTGFKNLGELRELMRGCFKRITAADVGLKIPELKVEQVVVQMTGEQRAFFNDLREKISEGSDDLHIFSALSSMAKASVDLQLVQPDAVGASSPKIEAVVGNIARVHGGDRGKHIVFCDHVDTHEKIRDGLVAAGVPAREIAIVNAKTAPTSDSRLRISSRFNDGDLSVVIGNTPTLGEGQDFQVDTGFIHHLDLPWDPDTLHQRNGRGVRQGNDRDSVTAFLYFLAGSNDAYRYETIMAKKEWKDLLWSDAETAENPCYVGMPDRREMIIMLSEDPAAARAAFEADDARAGDAKRTLARRMFNRDSALLCSMLGSLMALDSSAGGGSVRKRAEDRIAVLRNSMLQTPWLDDIARCALREGKPVVVIESTGEVITPDVTLNGELDHTSGKFVLRDVVRGRGGTVDMRLGGWAVVGADFGLVSAQGLPEGVTVEREPVAEAEAISKALSRPCHRYGKSAVHSLQELARLPEHIWMPHLKTLGTHVLAATASRREGESLAVFSREGAHGSDTHFVDCSHYASSDYVDWQLIVPTQANRGSIIDAAVSAWRRSSRSHMGHGLVDSKGQKVGVLKIDKFIRHCYGPVGFKEYRSAVGAALAADLEAAAAPATIIRAGIRIATLEAGATIAWNSIPAPELRRIFERFVTVGCLDHPIAPPPGDPEDVRAAWNDVRECVGRPEASTGKRASLRAGATCRDWLLGITQASSTLRPLCELIAAPPATGALAPETQAFTASPEAV